MELFSFFFKKSLPSAVGVVISSCFCAGTTQEGFLIFSVGTCFKFFTVVEKAIVINPSSSRYYGMDHCQRRE